MPKQIAILASEKKSAQERATYIFVKNNHIVYPFVYKYM